MTPPKKPSPGLDGLLSAATAAASKVSYAAPASYFQYDLVDAPPGTSRLVTTVAIQRKEDQTEGVLVNYPKAVLDMLERLFPGVPKSKAAVMVLDWAGPELERQGKALHVTRRG
ncbi:TPA: hypothetical protein QDA96_001459 [Burkholderia vietnamiensis]|nr:MULTISPECIES: hypothetical protein [Burkholderia cepacia complex]KVR67327.1 hypothetical protein WK24_15270 [Burkholderia vietnamiensis]KVS26797.1 hypothetical protein WK34_13540 [Burkholderia vietnamiensis]MBR8014100.1 hypothetical protein [Burkholderia vietnamiensis]MCA7919432.1 hypothetical protein [Burkholderia contaminans]UUX37176.1 hypothetical protein NTJ56_17825 [Burkholderia contaminans]